MGCSSSHITLHRLVRAGLALFGGSHYITVICGSRPTECYLSGRGIVAFEKYGGLDATIGWCAN